MKARRQREPRGPEYRLTISAVTREIDQSRVTELILETTRQFAAFSYELGIEEKLTDSTLFLKVTGLRPPNLTIPSSGPAVFRREYRNLDGRYDVTVVGLNGKRASFRVELTSTRIRLLKPPSDPFLEVLTHSTPGQPS